MLEMLSIVDLRFLLMVLLGSVAGLFVGAIPGLSVSMATALLVSITYTWDHSDALAMIMGVYVVGVFSGAVSAILINIPGAPSSVVTTLDGYPMSKKGQSYKALFTATIYSFVGSVFGFIALGLLAEPVAAMAIYENGLFPVGFVWTGDSWICQHEELCKGIGQRYAGTDHQHGGT